MDFNGLVGQLGERGRVRAEDTHDHCATGAGEDLLDPLAQIGLDVTLHAGIAVDGLGDLLQRLVVVDLVGHADPVLAEVRAIDLVAQQRLADVGAAVAHAGDLAQVLARVDGDLLLLGDRRRRLGEPVHQEVAFLEVRQQLRAGRHVGRHAQGEDQSRRNDRRSGEVHHTLERCAVPPLQRAEDRRLLVAQAAAVQHEQAECRGHRHGDEHRDQDGQTVREHEWLEERTGQSLEEEHRDDRHDVDDRCVGDRTADLDRGLEHDARRRLGATLGPGLSQTSDDVLDVDDGVVDHHPDRHHQPGQDHHVDRHVSGVEDVSRPRAATTVWKPD